MTERADGFANRDEFGAAYEAHHRQVLAYCMRRVGAQDAWDLAAEVFTVAWRRRDIMPGGEETLPWLYGVAYRVVSQYRRGSGRRARLERRIRSMGVSRRDGPEAQLVRRQEYDLVLEAAAKLKDLDQEVLRLAYWEELTHAQIASLLGTSVPAVKQRLHRVRKALAARYEKLGGAFDPDGAQGGGSR